MPERQVVFRFRIYTIEVYSDVIIHSFAKNGVHVFVLCAKYNQIETADGTIGIGLGTGSTNVAISVNIG